MLTKLPRGYFLEWSGQYENLIRSEKTLKMILPVVLLIIFMVTAPILQSGIEVNVPHTRTVKEITEERLVISIDKSQKVFLGNDPININQIGASLKQKIRDPQHQAIYLRSDEDVPFGAFATVMDAIKQAGISNVSIVTQPMDTHGGRH